MTWSGPSGAGRDEHRPPDRLLRERLDVGHVEAEPRQRLGHDLRGRPTDRGAERVVHRGGDAPAEHDGTEQVGREHVVDVERVERDRDDEHLADAAHRSREVGRRDDDHRDDDGEAHGREPRCVA